MYRSQILYSFSKIPLDGLVVFTAFFIAGMIRSHTDLIPYIHLPLQHIPDSQLFLFASVGAILWIVLFSMRGLYQITPEEGIFSELGKVFSRAFHWFFVYIGVVYLSSGFLFHYDIPRLVIFYAYLLSLWVTSLFRVGIYTCYLLLVKRRKIAKSRIVVLGEDPHFALPESPFIEFVDGSRLSSNELSEAIRSRSIDTLLVLDPIRSSRLIRSSIELCRIYGVRFAYPKVERATEHIPHREGFIGEIPIMEASSVTIEPVERVVKRIFDIVVSGLGLIVLSPLFFIIGLLIKIEDPSGPIIYRNRRIGYGGAEFDLFKFRYMYWRDSVKEAYGVSSGEDTALVYEESLKRQQNGRTGPLYKIENDPRKTRIGRIIEWLSIDELPQLVNVLIGEMSLVGPRPHQPREVEQYSEHQYQVLTIKPGITGMAQVNGREKNNFDEEVTLDTYYIEHYSLGLDLMILVKTIGVVILRGFRR